MISTSLRILQVNLNRSLQATESALQVAIELQIDLLLIQELWITTSNTSSSPKDYLTARSVSHQGFTQILPNTQIHLRPRTLVYVLRTITTPVVSIAANLPQDPDILVLDILEGNAKFQIVNIYNEVS